MAKNALIFADGKLGVGLGHISRCRALQAELELLGFQVELKDTQELEANLGNILLDLIAIDSYVLPLKSYEQAVKCAKVCLFFDDALRLSYPKAILLNNASCVNFVKYKEKYPHHILFLGSDYRLLQPPFIEALKSPTIPLKQKVQNVLITLGGKDILSLNKPLIMALREAYPHLNLHCITKDSTLAKQGVKVYFDLSAQEMVDLIQQMDLCICACGQSLGEILACGIPAIALEVASNQKANLESFSSCILSVSKSYLLPRDSICNQVLKYFCILTSLALRKTHQKCALEILNRPTKWKESLEKIF
ncbi:hypothetical protein [uncultured Helicobacter sp.]|uniref:hypothetical protein n=1 Tax=uncultured Helicobacter sp. TaxID=175537 RepID=UPI00260B557B|nr:hypothetical protein [uncultured Helicobacter sp.]